MIEAGVIDAIGHAQVRTLTPQRLTQLALQRVAPVRIQRPSGIDAIDVAQGKIILVGCIVVAETDAAQVGAHLAKEHSAGGITPGRKQGLLYRLTVEGKLDRS